MQIFINHLGYTFSSPKNAVVLASSLDPLAKIRLINADSQQLEAEFDCTAIGTVARWHQGIFHQVDFSSFQKLGRYFFEMNEFKSHTFTISHTSLVSTTLSDVLHYFKSQRCGGTFEQQDHAVPLLNSDQTVDVHGGWYDASGDVSKYLSHLSYANYLNPQQTPMVVWNMLKAITLSEQRDDIAPFTKTRLAEEALYGADFLVRMQDPQGFFYTTVFDKWSKDPKQRDICSYQTQEGIKTNDYHAGFRQGAGISIAALAAASQYSVCGDFSSQTYLESAIKGYQHLEQHNQEYLDDGIENIIDEYCALLASVALFKATSQKQYLEAARRWASALTKRQLSDEHIQHYWSANQDGSRPYFHAAEAGLPVIALLEYYSIESEQVHLDSTLQVITQALEFELSITNKVNNPFGYPRQYVKSVNSDKRDAFFIAQDNESGYWWQGENARVASLASMAHLALPILQDTQLKADLTRYAQSCLDWILGLNPYDMCMLDGHGHNNPDYLPELGFFNAKGGVCNGITAGFDDHEDIAFKPEKYKDDMLQNWRWGEQWIPHGAWYLLAITSQQVILSDPQRNTQEPQDD